MFPAHGQLLSSLCWPDFGLHAAAADLGGAGWLRRRTPSCSGCCWTTDLGGASWLANCASARVSCCLSLMLVLDLLFVWNSVLSLSLFCLFLYSGTSSEFTIKPGIYFGLGSQSFHCFAICFFGLAGNHSLVFVFAIRVVWSVEGGVLSWCLFSYP